MKFSPFFVYLVFIIQTNIYAQNFNRPTSDSVYALVVYYSSYGLASNLVNYRTYITDKDVVVFEEYSTSDSRSTNFRYYSMGISDKNFASLNGGKWHWRDNEILFPTHVVQDSLVQIAGYNCQLATYFMGGQKCKAYFTDAFGVKFSTTADYPGFALYYERQIGMRTWKFYADSIKPMKLATAWLYPEEMNANYDPNTGNHSITSIQATHQNYSRRGYKIHYQKSNFHFKNIHGVKRKRSDFKNKIVVCQFLEQLPDHRDSLIIPYKILARKYQEQDIEFITMTFENCKQHQNAALFADQKIDVGCNAQKFQKKFNLPHGKGYLIFDHENRIHEGFTLDRKDIIEVLDKNIQYLIERRKKVK